PENHEPESDMLSRAFRHGEVRRGFDETPARRGRRFFLVLPWRARHQGVLNDHEHDQRSLTKRDTVRAPPAVSSAAKYTPSAAGDPAAVCPSQRISLGPASKRPVRSTLTSRPRTS